VGGGGDGGVGGMGRLRDPSWAEVGIGEVVQHTRKSKRNKTDCINYWRNKISNPEKEEPE